jgi:HK97 family phage major capsid protein
VSDLIEARKAHAEAVDAMAEAVAALTTPAEDADVDALESRCAAAEAEVERRSKMVERLERIEEARAAAPVLTDDAEPRNIVVTRDEPVYRPDAKVSFFRDLVTARNDHEAAARLLRHKQQTEESRDVSSASNGYIPPVYFPGLEAGYARPGRPFADVTSKAALPAVGTSFTLPRLTGGGAVAAQTDGGGVQETDPTTDTVTTYVRTVAGQVDISQQLLDRSDPSFDSVVFRDLIGAYDSELDRQMLVGASGSNQHVGIANVSSINTVTYTSSTPTAAEALPKIYDAIQKVASNRYQYPTHILMHPRRAAAFAAGLSTSTPLFQQGGLNQAAGEQNGGVVGTIAGLPVVIDANIPTTDGAGTNQDAIYVVYMPDLVLMEGEVRTRVMEQPLSDTLEIRLQVFGYSAFLDERWPKGICKISGTGLVTPSF